MDLDSCKVSDAGVQHLGKLTNLKYLSLGFTHVTDQGLESLKGLKHLEGIGLANTKTTPEGIDRLRTALPKARIYK